MDKKQLDNLNNAIDCIRRFCQTQLLCVDCPIYERSKYHTCLFRTGIAPAHWGNAEIIISRKEQMKMQKLRLINANALKEMKRTQNSR